MVAERLTDRRVQTAKAPEGKRYAMLADGRGLYLRVSASGAKSWVWRYSAGSARPGNGPRVQHDLGLGPYPDVSLAVARDKALTLRRQRLAGQDPAAEKKLSRAAMIERGKAATFEEVAEQLIQARSAGWKGHKQAEAWRSQLRDYAYPVIGALPVGDIQLDHVLAILRPHWFAGGKVITANRARQKIEAVLSWAETHTLRPPGQNVARWNGYLSNILPAPRDVAPIKHHAAMPWREVPVFMAGLGDDVLSRALRFYLLVGAGSRMTPVCAARWDQIDLERAVWKIPVGVRKGGKGVSAYEIPLSPAAIAALPERKNDWAFPSPQKANAAVRMGSVAQGLFKLRLGRKDTAHGLRSTFADWVADNKHDAEAADSVLMHTTGNAVKQAYFRSTMLDRRRALLDLWAAYCMGG